MISRILRGILYLSLFIIPTSLQWVKGWYDNAPLVAYIAASMGLLAVLWEGLIDAGWPAIQGYYEVVPLAESVAWILVIAHYNALAQFGPFMLVPWVYHRRHLREEPLRPAYIAAIVLFFAGWSNSTHFWPDPFLAISAIATAALAYLIETKRTTITISAPAMETILSGEFPVPAEDKVLELRESFRKLRDAFRDLERRSAADRASMHAIEWYLSEERSLRDLAHAVREAITTEGVVLYMVPEGRDGFVPIAVSGAAPATDQVLEVQVDAAPILIREKTERALKAIRNPNDAQSVNVLLLHKGRMVGLGVLYDRDPRTLQEGEATLNEIAPLLAHLIREDRQQKSEMVRLKQTELLLGIASRTGSGPDAAIEICAELVESLSLTGCAILDLAGEEPKSLAQVGSLPFDLLQWRGGPGLRGWIQSGSPDTIIPDARNSDHADRTVALRRGLGSVALFPLYSSGTLQGAICGWTEAPHGITPMGLSTMRELIPMLVRRLFGGFGLRAAGMVDAETFRRGSLGAGSFAIIDLGRTDDPEEMPALTRARRRALAGAVAKLPPGGLLTRRSDGTLLAFLPGLDDRNATLWAAGLNAVCDKKWGIFIEAPVREQNGQYHLQKAS